MNQEKENNSEIDSSKSFGDSGMKFQEERESPQNFFRPGTPKIIRWLIKYSGGLIKNEKQATYVLVELIALAIIVSIILFFNTLGGPAISPKALEQPEYGLPIKD